MIALLTDPLTYPFMQRALIMTSCIGIVCAIFSCFLVLKGWSLLGDALSHAVLPGIAGAYWLGLPLVVGALTSGLACMGLIHVIQSRTRVKPDAVMGIVFSGLFGLGLLMISHIQSDVHLLHSLFGNVLGITPRDILPTVIISVISAGFMLIKRRDLMLHCFDPIQGHTIGINPMRLDLLLRLLLVLCIVISIKATGILLVIAMLITPGATGLLLSRSSDGMIGIAVLSTLIACISGVIISFHLDIATGPLIILIQFIGFILTLVHYVYRRSYTSR